MSDEEIAPSADAAAAADADDTTLATTAVNSEGDDFATHVEKLIHSKRRRRRCCRPARARVARDAAGPARGRERR